MFVQHLQSPHRLDCKAVVSWAGHLKHCALVGRHFTLLIGHVVAPGAVAFFERRWHCEVNGLSKVFLGWDDLALGLEDFKGANLLGLFPCH